MLKARVLVVVVLLPIGLLIIHFGGAVFAAVIALILGLAAWEYGQLFRASGLEPVGALVAAGAVLITLGRAFDGFTSAPWVLLLLVFASMTYHLIPHQRGREQAATDFAATLAGLLYIGWLGAYLISIRDLPEGQWWLLLVLPGVWLAALGGHFIGRSFGRLKISPRLSPKKTWEGYIAGLFFGTLGTGGVVALR